MSYDTTPHVGLKKPRDGTDSAEFFDYLEDNIDTLDASVAMRGDTVESRPAAGSNLADALFLLTSDDSGFSAGTVFHCTGTQWVELYDPGALDYAAPDHTHPASDLPDNVAYTGSANTWSSQQTFNTGITNNAETAYGRTVWSGSLKLPDNKDLHLAALADKVDVYRGVSVVNVEYHDGSSWVSWSPGDFGKAFDGDTSTMVQSIDPAHSRFRVTIDAGVWNKEFAATITKEWGSNGYGATYDVTYESSSDQSTWSERFSATDFSGGYQDFYTGLNEHGDQYHRWSFNVDLTSGQTFPIVSLSMFSLSTSKNPDPIQSTGATSARTRGNLDVGGNLTESGTDVALVGHNHDGTYAQLSRFPIPNSDLQNSTLTVAGNAVGLGGTTPIDLGDMGDVSAGSATEGDVLYMTAGGYWSNLTDVVTGDGTARTIRSGTSAPSDSTGENGDVYIVHD